MSDKERRMTFDEMPEVIADMCDRIGTIDSKLGAISERLDYIQSLLMKTPVANNRRPVYIEKASEITGLAVTTLYRYSQHGLIPSYKRGRKIYFFEDELHDWLKKGKVKEISERCKAQDKTIIQLGPTTRKHY